MSCKRSGGCFGSEWQWQIVSCRTGAFGYRCITDTSSSIYTLSTPWLVLPTGEYENFHLVCYCTQKERL